MTSPLTQWMLDQYAEEADKIEREHAVKALAAVQAGEAPDEKDLTLMGAERREALIAYMREKMLGERLDRIEAHLAVIATSLARLIEAERI